MFERFFGSAANITTDERTNFLPCFLCIVKSPVQMSSAGVRSILRSMSGSVQLKNLRLKSLTNADPLSDEEEFESPLVSPAPLHTRAGSPVKLVVPAFNDQVDKTLEQATH